MAILAWGFGQLLDRQAHHQLSSLVSIEIITKILPWLAVCLFIRPVIGFVKDKWLADMGDTLANNVRKQALDAIATLGLARNAFGSDGKLATHITREPDELMGYIRFNVQKYTAVCTPVIIAIAIATKSVMACLVLLLTAPLVPVFMALIGIKTAQKSREQMDALAQLGGRFLDWLRGMNTLVRLGAVDTAKDDIKHASTAYKDSTMSVLKVAFLNSAVLEFLSALSIALVAVYLGFGLMGLLPWQAGEAVIDYQSALFILLLVPEFYAPLRRLGTEYHAQSSAIACAKVLAPLITQGQKTNTPPKILHNTHTTTFDNPAIVLDKLSVISDGRVRLSDISLSILNTQKIAIIGASGSGKTTIFQVLLGFSEYQGSAKIAHQEIKDSDMATLRQRMGYLPQTPSLLPISIGENLRLAKDDASDDELWQALKDVGLFELVHALPNKLDTKLSERGGGLSGGQAGRLAIAQLVLQNADIWLLDEPTEHLDTDSKQLIHKLLHKLSTNKTVIWATHDTPVDWIDTVIHLKSNHDSQSQPHQDENILPNNSFRGKDE